MSTNFGDLVRRKMEQENLSLRSAGEKAGVAHTTIDRILKDRSVDFETMEKVCLWLGVPVTSILDIRQDNQEIMDQVASVLSLSPQLAGVFSELADKVISGEIDANILAEVAAFTSYRLNSPLFGAVLNESDNTPVLHEGRKDYQ
jgi:transcriptional regulator with XRE-family HTH domain